MEVDLLETLSGLGYDPSTVRWMHSGPDTIDVASFPVRDPANWRAEWQTLRDLVIETGRWPVCTDHPFSGARELLRFNFHGEGSESAAATFDALTNFDADSIFNDYIPGVDESPEFYSNMSTLEAVLSDVYLRPDELSAYISAANEALEPDASTREIERWAVRHQLKNPTPPANDYKWDDSLGWPDIDGLTDWIVLAPTNGPVDGIAYVSAHGTEPVPSLAIARRWASAHGAELVGVAGCSYLIHMPELVTDPDEIWRAAIEMYSVWSCSHGAGPGGAVPITMAIELASLKHWMPTIWP